MTGPIGRSDLPLTDRLWLWYSASIPALQLAKRVDEGRFESVREYREAKRVVSDR